MLLTVIGYGLYRQCVTLSLSWIGFEEIEHRRGVLDKAAGKALVILDVGIHSGNGTGELRAVRERLCSEPDECEDPYQSKEYSDCSVQELSQMAPPKYSVGEKIHDPSLAGGQPDPHHAQLGSEIQPGR